MRESSCDRIPITETRASTFRLLLQYIYTGKLNMRGEELLQSSQQQQHVEALIDLLGCAHKYGFVSLQHAVSDYLESILDVKNVCAIYDIAALYALDKLERTCVRFIDRNCVTLIRNQALLSLSQSSLAQILARDSFCAPELEIFHVVKRWHEVNNIEKPREELMSKLRLQLMSLDELLNDVRQSNLLSSNVILDAIKLKHESTDMDLKYRGVLYPNENYASNRYQALVVKGDFRTALLDGDVSNYDFDKGFTYHTIDDSNQNSIVVCLGNPSIFNEIKMLLWDKDIRSYSYFVEVSMNEKDWIRVIDYSVYLCRSWQTLLFKPVVARYIKVVGVRNTANRIFHLVSMEVRYTTDKYTLKDQLIVPHYNVASVTRSAVVLEGVSRERNALINGDYKNYDWDSGYTCHQLGSGSISIQLAQPFIVSSMRLLLWDCDNRSYSYCIETSLDQVSWTMVVDKREQACRSWQIVTFEPTLVSFIRITGTHNTANEVFHCVHFECPCDQDVLARYLEHLKVDQKQSNLQSQPTTLTSTQPQTQSQPLQTTLPSSSSLQAPTINSTPVTNISNNENPSIDDELKTENVDMQIVDS